MVDLAHETYDSDIVKFHLPCSLSVNGPTSAGKTYWVYKFLQNIDQMISSTSSPPSHVLYCYNVDQKLYGKIKEDVKNVSFHEGLPSLDVIYELSEKGSLLVVLDDLSHKLLENEEILILLTQGSHHKNISVVFMNHNLFQKGKHSRTIALNVKYLILFSNPRDNAQMNYLGRQMFPEKSKRLRDAYSDAVKNKKWGYLVVDLQPHTIDKVRLRTNIFPEESPCIVYESK